MRIGRLARECGVSVETIRYYERVGVLPPPARGTNNYRQYTGAHRARLGFVRRARELGFSLEEVRSLLALADGRRYTCAQVRELGRAHLQSVRDRLRDLQRMEASLAALVAGCDGAGVPECHLLDSLFAGSGPEPAPGGPAG